MGIRAAEDDPRDMSMGQVFGGSSIMAGHPLRK
jgi:hypothetical protein